MIDPIPCAGVTGWPASHSLSPALMSAWLEETRSSGRYGVIELPPERFEAGIRALASAGFRGVNVTVPHKVSALAVSDHATDTARAVGAANRLVFDADQGVVADNTDVAGVAAALAEDDGRSAVTLIGAGGAARAALYYLARQDRDVRIVNRTVDRARDLAAEFGVAARVFSEPGPDALGGAGLVINATSLGMKGQPALAVDLGQCAPAALIFDMVYVPLETPLLAAARRGGFRTTDGLAMLIGQARSSFEAFFGVSPPARSQVRSRLETLLRGRA